MTSVSRTIRLSVLVALLSTAGGALWAWRRDRDTAPLADPDEPQWPPLRAVPAGEGAPDTASGEGDPVAVAAVQDEAGEGDRVEAAATQGEAGQQGRVEAGAVWVEPGEDGACPIEFPIKANDNSGIYHVPDGRFYERTKAERCYVNTDAAERDGYRAAKA